MPKHIFLFIFLTL